MADDTDLIPDTTYGFFSPIGAYSQEQAQSTEKEKEVTILGEIFALV